MEITDKQLSHCTHTEKKSKEAEYLNVEVQDPCC